MKLNRLLFFSLVVTYTFLISNAAFSMDSTPVSDETDSDECMDSDEECFCIEPINDASLPYLNIKEWLSKPMISKDFLYLANKFIQHMTYFYASSKWLYDKCQHEQMRNTTENLPLPCIAKLVVQQDTRIAIIGDIHGEMDTVEGLFLSLQHKKFIDDFLRVAPDAQIIFLGDYTDRGEDSLKVLTSVLLLAVKNPGQVMLLRGNHEDIVLNKRYGILAEIKEFEKNLKTRYSLMNNLSRVYEFMPVGMFLGFSGQKQTPFYLLTHGGPDIRYDYSDFLNLNTEENSRGERLCFWNLTRDDLLKTTLINQLIDKINTKAAANKEFSDTFKLHLQEELTHGFLWNNIHPFTPLLPLSRNPRGKSCISLGAEFTKMFLDLFTAENVKIVGLIRGHQHSLAKAIGHISNPEDISPSCSYFSSANKAGDIIRPGDPTVFDNNFLITTVISGQINMENQIVNYAPTFLDLHCIGQNRWRFEAVEYCV